MRFVVLFIAVFLYADNLEISSKFFEYNKTKNMATFKKHVKVIKGRDTILSDELYIYTLPSKKLKQLIAKGHVRFKVFNNNILYRGSSDELIYFPKKQKFVFRGHVHITKQKQQLYGQEVVIDKKNGLANVIGDNNKPLKFILKE
ncbi:MAG: hypothetical protein GXO40_03030 [Epsilonproteobacteria bacterium]|nr:hypothetical protein [Campylobacterota bacterium]